MKNAERLLSLQIQAFMVQDYWIRDVGADMLFRDITFCRIACFQVCKEGNPRSRIHLNVIGVCLNAHKSSGQHVGKTLFLNSDIGLPGGLQEPRLTHPEIDPKIWHCQQHCGLYPRP